MSKRSSLQWGKSVFQFLNGEVFSSYSSTNTASLSSLQIGLIFALSKGIEVTYLGARFFKVLNTVLYATFNTCTVSLTPELFIDISTIFSFTSGLRAS